ncbi:ROK family protein [Promicromonospora thailandica]|uniref:Sugar kinase of the NBD/HSP70 family, may containing an N-terminal HTH domain n=1 Tax=Promicromonospora thailandica TaxID=765201 RepID=A0A9X2JYQ7_9MICO|nr:ROK family transcriptional regulator [Promicromonospora thailandica]MCP2267468.1 Sugar kinase of the NBD/HSP70 family, may containing an N-terminal HTH domain [Promicromonospora thailandica]BFF21275.1 ROK family protein [Promicromonospora thailandica]
MPARPQAPTLSPAATRVFQRLVMSGDASRTALANDTGLTPGAITRAVRPLLEAGLLDETGDRASSEGALGRPATMVTVRARAHQVVGVKITADQMFGVVADLRCQVLDELTLPVTDLRPDAVVAQVAELVDHLRAGRPEVGGVGLAVSGDVDAATGHVAYSPFLGWRDLPLGELVARRTGLPTTVENDVRALLTGERWYGVGRGLSSLALVTVGTGIGCALLVNGQVVHGSFGVAGEVGHVLVDPDGPLCHCGNRGCVEAIAGSAAILDGVAAAGLDAGSVGEVAELARSGQADAVRVLADAGSAIGTGIATIANLLGAQHILITGEAIGSDYDVMDPHVREAFEERAFGSAARSAIELRPLRFVDWARGAAACAVEDFVTHYGRS